MNNDRNKKQREIERLNKKVQLIDKQLQLLELIETKEKELEQQVVSTPNRTPDRSHYQTFPEGSTVRFSRKSSEKPYLRGKRATVIGHTPQFVKVKRGEDEHNRFPKNLIKELEDVYYSAEETEVQNKEGKKGRNP